MELKVGELAKRTGLTVRTLHHYDEVGLLQPSSRTPAGHRLYGAADVQRLQQIASLRQLGLSLPDIAECLTHESGAVGTVLSRHIAHLRERISTEERLVAKLQALLDYAGSDDDVPADLLLDAVATMTLFERYYSDDQLQQLEDRAALVGPGRMQDAQQEWETLYADLERARQAGLAPSDDAVQVLARKAQTLIAEFTGGDAQIRTSLDTMAHAEQPAMHRLWGIGEELGAYYAQAMAAVKGA